LEIAFRYVSAPHARGIIAGRAKFLLLHTQ
jgi:hypothetical protein